jgi:hypothetical protein
MPTLYDARGNEIRGLFADRVNGEVNTDARTFTNLLAALNAEVLIDVDGCNTMTVDVRTAAASLTYVFEATVDGSNYFPVPALQLQGLLAAVIATEVFITSVTVATTHSAHFMVNCAGYKRLRVRVSAYTSGNITVALRASAAQVMVYNKPIPQTQWITATAAANTINTATLPAAGVGLFHNICYISGMRNATALLAGTATLLITTTNLPNNPVWSVGNAMAAGGTQIDIDFQPANPLRSTVANTNTTVVYPACGAAVLSRLNVGYYNSF